MEFDIYGSAQDPAFRAYCKTLLPEPGKYSIKNIYWSRCGVGITCRERQTDVLHFSFNYSSAWDVYKTAIALKCAATAATQHKYLYIYICVCACIFKLMKVISINLTS